MVVSYHLPGAVGPHVNMQLNPKIATIPDKWAGFVFFRLFVCLVLFSQKMGDHISKVKKETGIGENRPVLASPNTWSTNSLNSH